MKLYLSLWPILQNSLIYIMVEVGNWCKTRFWTGVQVGVSWSWKLWKTKVPIEVAGFVWIAAQPAA